MSGENVNLGAAGQPIAVNVSNQDQGAQGGISADSLVKLVMMLNTKGTTAVDGKEVDSIQERAISFKSIGDSKSSMDIGDPKIAKANDELVEQFMIQLSIEGADGKPDSNKGLVLKLTDGLEGLKAVSSMAAAGDVGKSQTCAFLGGLTMVALSEILANYAKVESTMKKLSSVLFLSTQACMLDLANSIAKNIEEKAKDQAMAKIAEACISAVSAGVQIVGSIRAIGELRDRPAFVTNDTTKVELVDVNGNKMPLYHQAHDPVTQKPLLEHKQGDPIIDANGRPTGRTYAEDVPQYVKDASGNKVQAMRAANPTEVQIATIQNTMIQVVGQLSGAANNMIEAWSILQVGHLEAQNIQLEALKEQMSKMQDSFKGIENAADQRLNDSLDMLKNFFTNLAQAFKSITNRG